MMGNKKPKDIDDLTSITIQEVNSTKVSVVENTAETLFRVGFDLEKRTVFVDGDIDPTFGDWFRKLIWTMEQQSEAPITVWLNTPGGNVVSMYSFYDTVIASPCDITIIGHGEICSAGVLMLACGDKRFVTENCVLMSHEGADFSNDGLKYSEAKDRRKYEDWTMAQWNLLMARHTPYDAAYWKSITTRKAEFWLLGGKAIVQHGLADGLYEPAGKITDRFADPEEAAPATEEETP